MARPLIEALNEPGVDYDLSSLIVIASTAAVFSPSVKLQYLERFPNAMLMDAVGSSEQGFTGMASVTKESLDAAGDDRAAALRVNPGRDVAVFDEQWQRVAPGLRRRSASWRAAATCRSGYYKDPQKSAETFVEVEGRRWAIPGDYATVEADGTIIVLGRGSVSINSGGEKIFPEEVEGALKSHPAVFDALVVGVPDERWGSRVAAVVQLRPGTARDARRAGGALPHAHRRLQGAARAAPRRADAPLTERQARLSVGAAAGAARRTPGMRERPPTVRRGETGSVNWTALAALAASLTALIALATAVMIFRQVRNDTQRILANTALDSIWRFDTQWNSDGMADARSAAAASLLDGQPGSDLDVVLDFFDQIALLANRKALDDEMVWYQFYWPMANYWGASQDYVREVARDDALRWEQLSVLMPRLAAIEARRRKRAAEQAVPTAAQIKDFLTSESEGGECQDDEDAGAQKMPL